MKEKIGIALIVLAAVLCLFGCSEELPEEEMVLNPTTVDVYNLSGEIGGHLQ